MKIVDNMPALFRQKVDLAKLLNHLDFADEEVVPASKAQAFLFFEASVLRIQTMRRLKEAEAKLSVIKSEVSLRVRHKLAENNPDKRVTEGMVAAKLGKNREIQQAEAEVAEAQQEEEFARLLLEAYRHRRDALKVVAEVIGAEVAVSKINQGQAELKQLRSKLEKKYKHPGSTD